MTTVTLRFPVAGCFDLLEIMRALLCDYNVRNKWGTLSFSTHDPDKKGNVRHQTCQASKSLKVRVVNQHLLKEGLPYL